MEFRAPAFRFKAFVKHQQDLLIAAYLTRARRERWYNGRVRSQVRGALDWLCPVPGRSTPRGHGGGGIRATGYPGQH